MNPMNFGIEVAGSLVYPMLKRFYREKTNSVVFTTVTNDQKHIEVPVHRGLRLAKKIILMLELYI
jgi:molecular chaperone DnaK (HSP70)